MKRFLAVILVATAALITIGCGASQKKIEEGEQRISALVQKGVPDSILSKARVYLYQAREEQKRGNMGKAKEAQEQMLVHIAEAEKKYEADLSRLKPYLDSIKNDIAEQTKELTGLHKRCLDSLMNPIDSLIGLGYLMQADAKLDTVAKYVPDLVKEQELSKKVRKDVVGVWRFKDITKHSQDKSVHAVEEKIFTFRSNGKGHFIEQKSGKVSPFAKQDYRFDSYGKWDVKGDTIHLLVDRFQRKREIVEDLKKQDNGKKEWIKTSQTPYDSAITDGSQNRFVEMSVLKMDFKHSKK